MLLPLFSVEEKEKEGQRDNERHKYFSFLIAILLKSTMKKIVKTKNRTEKKNRKGRKISL